jgi:hypothetical protein
MRAAPCGTGALTSGAPGGLPLAGIGERATCQGRTFGLTCRASWGVPRCARRVAACCVVILADARVQLATSIIEFLSENLEANANSLARIKS